LQTPLRIRPSIMGPLMKSGILIQGTKSLRDIVTVSQVRGQGAAMISHTTGKGFIDATVPVLMDQRIEAMARVLARYSLRIEEGELVFLSGEVDTLPLLKALFKEVMDLGAHPQTMITDQTLREILLRYGSQAQLLYEPPIMRLAAERADVFVSLWGNSNTRIYSNVEVSRIGARVRSSAEIQEIFSQREGRGELRWCGAQFPTDASAQEASMSLAEYEEFVYKACLLDQPNPVSAWQRVAEEQETLCRMLEGKRELRVLSKDTDLTLGIEGRKWINCCGLQNFPDGEVFTSPLEDSAQGRIRFSFPGISFGREVEDIRLVFEKGVVVEASATKGEDILRQLLTVDEGASRVGEIGIGTNYGITRFTRNMLFDEKIGGTVHLAIGRSLPEALGVNSSSIHWDMLCDMRDSGRIYADDELIYQNGRFLG
jgi:aminopeptidase